jgi:DNA polymerase I-like protein with 3'-5' exonuclease and polymerase domains
VTLPFDIWRRQWKRLGDEGLLDLYRMECRLIPLLVEMRWRGVRVDVEGARSRSTWLAGRVEAARAVLGPGADPNSAVWLAAAFGQLGVPCSKTDKGNPSIPKGWLEYLAEQGPAPWLIDADAEGAQRLAQAILDIRRLEKARGTFIDGYILGHEVGGRVHGSFHPLRTDENGTVSGRLASSDPNLQNIPARDKEIKLWTRGLFLPEEGERLFSPDYSQLEYRLMVHRAVGKGAEEARQRYRDDPTTDYHTFTQELVREITGRLLPRKAIKNVNFGKIFGMGMGKLIETLGMSEDEAREFFTAYDSGIPFAKATLAALAREAATRGEILTIGGRKSRFPFYEPRRKMGNVKMLPLDAARQAYGADIVRAKTHKALNAYTQGGGGDIIKSAMLAVWDEGEVPLLTVHDELVFSLPPGEEGDRRGARILELMQGACPELSVPLLAVGKWGLNWGEVA